MIKDITLLEQVPMPLLKWYEKKARILPWREEPTAYRVWVSEIMLQQTRVEAVKPYFEKFLQELPDIEALASASQQQLLKLWEGLGYYNRVKNLQKAAQVVVEEYAGQLPKDYQKLLELPGIGEYTAGAISSIAFGLPVAAVDGNVMRVITRISGNKKDITKSETKKEITACIQQILPKQQVSNFNQALMELGATVCLPNGIPICENCPVANLCYAYQTKTMLEFPVKTAKKERKKENKLVFLLYHNNKVAIQKRPENGLLAGLWEFPMIEGSYDEKRIQESLKSWSLTAKSIIPYGHAKHIFTHIQWNMEGVIIEVDKEETFLWADRKMLQEEYPIPSAYRYFVKEMLQRLH